MGSIQYDGDRLYFDDRLLAHLQVVIVQKLTQGEAFLMPWTNAPAVGSGRTAIWIQPGVPFRFNFDGNRSPAINVEWLRALQTSARSSTGLIVTAEDGRLALCGVRPSAGSVARHLD